MRARTTVSLDGVSTFYLSTFFEGDERVRSYSIDVEKADDSHYEFTPEAMNTFEGYLATRYTGTTLIDRLKEFVADFPSTRAAEGELCRLVAGLDLEVKQFHFDTYD